MAAVMVLMTLVVIGGGAAAQGPGDWTECSSNPVFGQGIGGPRAYYPSVLYDPDEFSGHGYPVKYKMWYGTSGAQTGLATSDDGIAWTDRGVVMADGYHATVEYYPDGFAGTNSEGAPSGDTMYYRMWYWDVGTIYDVSAIGYTESPDGVDWYNYQPLQNGVVPIVSGGDPWWNRGSYGPSDILYNPSVSNTGTDWTFTMYYDGTTGGDEAIGIGFSADGITWTGYDVDSDDKADPVLNGTYVSGDWDYNYVSRATIIKNADDDYEMWYSGGVGKMNHGIGYATSSDGISWTKDTDNPIFRKDDGVAWRSSRSYTPAVIKTGNSYQMWFAGKDKETGYYSIGYATAAPPLVPMLEFEIEEAKIEVANGKASVKGKLAPLNLCRDGVDISEDVTVTVGPVYDTFEMVDKKGKWEYERPKNGEGNIKKMKIDWNNGKFDISMDKADLSGLTDPDNVTIGVQIGNDLGEETILMTEKKDKWEYKALK